MARTFRNPKTKFDDEQKEQKGNRRRHSNNHVTGGIKPKNIEDDLTDDLVYDKYGVRIRNFDDWQKHTSFNSFIFRLKR